MMFGITMFGIGIVSVIFIGDTVLFILNSFFVVMTGTGVGLHLFFFFTVLLLVLDRVFDRVIDLVMGVLLMASVDIGDIPVVVVVGNDGVITGSIVISS